MRPCWCGQSALEPFLEDYMLCPACGTLVSRARDAQRYDRDYWYAHQEADLGQPTIEARAREDLPERCVYWLRHFLRTCLPPGKVLELGCAHGGFTALLSRAGFAATGLEIDPAVAGLAGETFGIEVLDGPLENQDIAPGSLKAVVLMDVLEHLPDPVAELCRISRLLAPDGVVFVQTPCLPAGAASGAGLADDAPFRRMLLPAEHLHLFSEQAVRRLFSQAGLDALRFWPALFPYDMLFVAGRGAVPEHAPEAVADALVATPDGRLVLGLLDAAARADRAETAAETLAGDVPRRQGGLEGVVREMASHRAGNSWLLALATRSLPSWPGVSWFVNKVVSRFLRRRVAASRQAPRVPGGDILVAVDLTPVLPGGDNGGAKLMTVLLLQELRAMRPGWRFLCIVSDAAHDELAYLDAPNVERVRVGALERLRGLAAWKGRPVDILFCPFTMPYFHHPDVPVISVVYDLQYAYFPQFFSPDEEAGRERTFLTAARVAERLVCISEHTRQTVLAQGVVPPERTATVHISLPRRLGKAGPGEVDAMRRRLGLDDAPYLLYPANFWQHKNHRMLLTAFGMFAAGRPDHALRLVLTGADTGLRRELAESAGRMGLGDRVVFAGYVSDEELSALLTGAMALVFPSLFEGFGMPLVEAMAVGTPILSSDATSLPEVAGDAALFFDPRRPDDIVAAITRLVDEPGLCDALVRKGYERLAAIGGPGDMAREYLRIFENVLARDRTRSTAVRGLYRDGWCGARLFVAHGPAEGDRKLRVRLELPNEAPAERVRIGTFVNGYVRGAPITLTRGRAVTIVPELSPCGGYVEFLLDGARRLDGRGPGVDPRRLSVRCHELRLSGGDGDLDLLREETGHGAA